MRSWSRLNCGVIGCSNDGRWEAPAGKQERLKGIEPSSEAWEATVLPLHHSRSVFINVSGMLPLVKGVRWGITFCKEAPARWLAGAPASGRSWTERA